MATSAQIAANQANALLSTGPRTEAGRARSASNALRHGFTSQTVLLEGEDPAAYDALLAGIVLCFPTNGHFALDRAVREMANAEWRLRRVRRQLELVINKQIHELRATQPAAAPAELQIQALESLLETSKLFPLLLRYETKFERQYDRARREWTNYQKTQDVAPDWVRLEEVPIAPPKPPEHYTKCTAERPAHPLQTPRNAPCPCGSGEKYKRCCGKGAPPVLGPSR